MCCQHNNNDDKPIALPCATAWDCQGRQTSKQEFVLRALLTSGIVTRTFSPIYRPAAACSDPLTQIDADIDKVIRQAERCYSRATQ